MFQIELIVNIIQYKIQGIVLLLSTEDSSEFYLNETLNINGYQN